ncbi:hypothetical protein Q5P01_010444 [Channa striata]|uniref:Uncharacterized protein n=1 Tax=Channa striata TaxID=64152 RepID=A0AA88N242_CHASR|nr:hypothetical protein Q5P01_010444 [Channa striata]
MRRPKQNNRLIHRLPSATFELSSSQPEKRIPATVKVHVSLHLLRPDDSLTLASCPLLQVVRVVPAGEEISP